MAWLWITGGGVAMCLLSLAGAIALALPPPALRNIMLPLVAFAAGTLLGGAVFHLLPAAIHQMGNSLAVYNLLLAGFVVFFMLEQFLHWHHCHEANCSHKPMTWLILIADGIHNFIGGMAVGAAFLTDVRLGMSAWLAAAAHEVPQELGDFAVLVHGGVKPKRALWINFLSALPFLAGGLVAAASARLLDVAGLLAFAAGNFLYISAADLIPEVKHHAGLRHNVFHLASLLAGLAVMLGVRIMLGHAP